MLFIEGHPGVLTRLNTSRARKIMLSSCVAITLTRSISWFFGTAGEVTGFKNTPSSSNL
jgi:hypothetical protein